MTKKKRVLDALLFDEKAFIKSMKETDEQMSKMTSEEIKADIEAHTIHSLDEQFAGWFELGFKPRNIAPCSLDMLKAYTEYYERRMAES